MTTSDAINEDKETYEANCIKQVREGVKDLIDKRYDTKWNILRWLQSNDFIISKTIYQLRKHLKFRKERKLDEDESESLLQFSVARDKYMPLSIVGTNRKNGDRLIAVDLAGRTDVAGLLKAVQPTEYLHTMFRVFETLQRKLMKMEEELNVQCYVYYIFDLEGLSFDPTLLSVVNGAFRVSWQQTAVHYREFIDKFIVVNSPSYINVLWAAISPFIPENSRHRIVFAGNDWKEELLEICDADFLPVRYGGVIADEKVIREVGPVPQELYWSPRPDQPKADQLHKISIAPSKHRLLTFKIDSPTRVLLYSYNESEIVFSLFYGKEENTPEGDLEVMVCPVPKCGMTCVDMFDYICDVPGFYTLKLANEASWLMSSTYKFMVRDESGEELKPINFDEKWIKKGRK